MATNNESNKLNTEQTFDEKVAVTLRHHIDYNGKSYEKLEFDFSKLRGKDSLDVENELQALGKTVLIPAFSGEYLIRIAAKACAEPVGADIFEEMNLHDYNTVKNAARSFLLSSE